VLATGDLLRAEGYECVTVHDGESALKAAMAEPFDLLICDLEMPGNADLELVRALAEKSGGLPVIILTGFPSVRSAVACIDFPVVAYLTKPVAFPELLERVARAVKRFRAFRTMQVAEERLGALRAEYQQVSTLGERPRDMPVDLFLTLTLRSVTASLTDLEQLGRALSSQTVNEHPCQLMNCPRGAQFQTAVIETIGVLEETKGAFKSKALGDLRHKLELLLKTV